MLNKYRAKRDFSKTPEPKGTTKRVDKNSKKRSLLTFVVQEHAATRLHFDFRLEANGVLLSWAVPKGPSLNPHDKRLAVMTEDHPLDYAGFEGIIPSGYGAGEVIVWDHGTYLPLKPDGAQLHNRDEAEKYIKQGIKAGKFSFYLQGEKLEGTWTLVRIRGKEKDWLLIKNDDQFANDEAHPWKDDSILSGQTLADLQDGKRETNKKKNSKQRVNKRTTKATIKKKTLKLPSFQPPMLATLTTNTFSNKDWIFEPKLDGIRGLAYVNNGKVDLYSRRGLSLSGRYPALTDELASLGENMILDGEIVALDQNRKPSFQKLQERSGLTREDEVAQAEADNPVIYYLFDILFYHGQDLRTLPFAERRKVLEKNITATDHIKIIEELGSNGETAFKACLKNGLEGIVAKRLASIYQSERRSTDWLKIKNTLSAEFIICGYTKGTGARKNTFGALILGEYDQAGKLVHVCSVGTGFDEKKLLALLKVMKPLETKVCPFSKRPVGVGKPVWLKPQLIAEIKYAERTKDGSLRVPVFLHLREDIEPKKVKPMSIVETSQIVKQHQLSKPKNLIDKILANLDNDSEELELDVEGNKINFTHLNKTFWPQFGSQATITKRDYVRYLTTVSPWFLSHLRDRFITLIRFPHGVSGNRFFQKHWPENLPGFVQTVNAFTEHENKDQTFLLCNNLSTLLWLAQIADLEIHTSHTRISKMPDAKKIPETFTGSVENIENSLLNYPDYLVFDLDPYLYSGKESKGAEPELHRQGFKRTCEIALSLRELLDELSIRSFVKTSGKTGLHIYIPIKRNIDYDNVRAISGTIGHYILDKHPKLVTMDWAVKKRTGRVFLDHNMNARSKSLVSIFSPRVSREATVSTSINWDEVGKVYPTDFTIESVPERLKKMGDPWADILTKKNDLSILLRSWPLKVRK